MSQPFVEPCSSGLIKAEPRQPVAGGGLSVSHRRWVLAACVLASSMAFIDGSALTVALPALRNAFGADFASVQWVINGYVLTLASLTLIGGVLSDYYGKARMLVIGCLLFGIASAACALAPSITWLVAGRIVQGMAAAIVTPASLALIGASYPEDERGGAIGIWAAASSITTAVGPVLGGWLTERFGWPAVFWINPPLALAAAIILIRYASMDVREQRRFDFIGAAVVALSLSALAWALSLLGRGEAPGVAGPTAPAAGIFALALLGITGLLLYIWWEKRTSHPMTPPRLVRKRGFAGLNVMTLLVYMGLSIMFFLLPFELVGGRGLSATDTGLVFLPFSLCIGFLSRAFGRLADRLGPRIMLVIGPAGAATAYLWMSLARDSSLFSGVIMPMFLLGLSFAVLVAPLTATVMSIVDRQDQGLAAGINNAASRIAQLLGVALAAGVASAASGYQLGLVIAATASFSGSIAMVVTRGLPVKAAMQPHPALQSGSVKSAVGIDSSKTRTDKGTADE